MSKIIVETFASNAAEALTKAIWEGKYVVKQARIFYDTKKGLPKPEETDKYPLILKGSIGEFVTDIHVYGLSAGYPGTGPNALVNILKTLEFDFDENDILTTKRVDLDGKIKLIYVR